ncbi:unnamed protein product [Oppiella nova]|uniref:Uncharacterized protein n=1 Tax=Oppiella nova TaxID=334625 RepID=A0A7R9M1W5_9ACAR|nr:unnamed protein product [Oppiella nova]CAG2168868.1 unnamed protein product [Oppiella nova]
MGFICVILLLLLIVCLYYLFHPEYKCRSIDENKCYNKECISSAASILNTLNTNINPCDDFYEYSCGNSIDHRRPINLMNQSHYNSGLQLKNLIESLIDDKQPRYIQNLVKYYRSCLDEDLIGKLDVKPLTDIIGRLRGWPVLNSTQWFSNANHYHWLNTYIMMREIGITANSLIDLKVEKDVRNSSRFIAHIDQPVFNINITDNNQLDQYTKLMVTIATMMGVYETDARNEWLSVLEFEMKLIKFSLSSKDHQNNTYHSNSYMKVSQLKSLAPNINWIQFFTEFVRQPIENHVNISDLEVIVLAPNYIKELNQILVKTDKKVLANYLIWKVIYQYIPLLGRRWREPLETYLLNTDPNYTKENRWQTCLKQLQTYMPLALGNIYLKHNTNRKSEIEVISMINDIKESFIEIVDKYKWMSDGVKSKANEKIKLMKLGIGFPQDVRDDNQMDNWLTHILYHLNLERGVNPADIIIKYRGEDNTLLISNLIIDGLYREDVPMSLNFGSFGVLISEQMLNILSEVGRLYDENGVYGKWWDTVSDNGFDTRIKCFHKKIKHFDDMTTGMHLSDRYKLIEKYITDMTLLKQTLMAYRAHTKQMGPQLGLIGLNHTSEQLFWISAVNTYYNDRLDYQDNNSYDMMKYR